MSTVPNEPRRLAQVAYEALLAIARGSDHVHQTGILRRRSGIALDRGLHPLVTTIGQRGPMRTTDLAAALALETSTVSRHVARLERAGLVERAGDPADGRASFIALSPTGRHAFEAIREAWENLLTEALVIFGPSGSRRFAEELLRFGECLEALDPTLEGPSVEHRTSRTGRLTT